MIKSSCRQAACINRPCLHGRPDSEPGEWHPVGVVCSHGDMGPFLLPIPVLGCQGVQREGHMLVVKATEQLSRETPYSYTQFQTMMAEKLRGESNGLESIWVSTHLQREGVPCN